MKMKTVDGECSVIYETTYAKLAIEETAKRLSSMLEDQIKENKNSMNQ